MTRVTVKTRNPSVQTENPGSSVSPATQSEVNTGTETGKYVSPATLAGWTGGGGGGVSGLTATRIPYAQNATTLVDSASLTWDDTNKKLSIGDAILYAPESQTNIYLITTSGGNIGGSGLHNVFIGDDLKTGELSATADGNVCIGWKAGKSMSAASHYNVYIGTMAGEATSGASENVGIGYRALQFAYGEDNVGIGFGAGAKLSSGVRVSACRNNIFIGYYAGSQSSAYGTNAFLDGSHSIFIGDYTYAPSPTEGAQINIGNSIFVRNNTDANPVPDEQTGNVGLMIANPTARLHIKESSTSYASLRIPHGTAPTNPNDGDIWTTTAGLFVRINGVTVGPLS